MGLLGKLFGGRQRAVTFQLPQVQDAIANCVLAFRTRTGLSYAHIFPIMQSIGVRLYVKDFGVQATRKLFERLVKAFTENGTLMREDQFKNFGRPDIQPHEFSPINDLNAILWSLSNDL
jgi:hypothetical protein